jgi:hypothetical protein
MKIKSFLRRIFSSVKLVLRQEAEVIGFFLCLFFYCQVFHPLFGLLGLFFVACDFRTTLLLSNTPTAAIAFLVCHFPSPPFCGLGLSNLIFYREI